MLVVVGSPAARLLESGAVAGGLAAAIAIAAARNGAAVEIVGRVGEDGTGDAVLQDLATAGVGHVAILRTAAEATPLIDDAERRDDDAPIAAALDEPGADDDSPAATQAPEPSLSGLPIDAGDLDLALRYLPDYRVIVVATDLDETASATLVGAVVWSGARLIAVTASERPPFAMPPDATVLERPRADPDGSFAQLVARYAVAIDRGDEAGDAFRAASSGSGWANVVD